MKKEILMDHIFTKKTLSFAMAIVMFFSIFSVGAVISTNSVYADSEPAKPDQSKNAISMPDSVKRGVYATIDITGDRYIDIKDKL